MIDNASLVVQKFGGTSVATVERIKAVALRALLASRLGRSVILVVSAMSGETNRLLALARQVSPIPYLQEEDVVAATGEQVVAGLMAMAIRSHGGKARSLLGHQVRILTNSTHSDARIQGVETERLQKFLRSGEIPVIAGFQGVDDDGNTTTLGRGGSDTTAVAIAASLGGVDCEIYTDVDGVYTADPNVCPDAKKLERVSYKHMLTMASLGAKVLHGRSVGLAMKYGVPVQVKSSFAETPGTLVTRGEGLEEAGIRTLACDRNVARINTLSNNDGFLQKLGEAMIPIDGMYQSGQNTSFLIRKTDIARAMQLGDLRFNDDIAKVSIIGHGLQSDPKAMTDVARLFKENAIPIHSMASTEMNISCWIPLEKAESAVRALHCGFELGNT